MNAALKTSMNGESRNAPLLDVAIEAKRFGPVPVIRDVALAVPRGEITALVGPSGCGKSTLLRIVAGLDRQFNGHCRVLGEPARLHSGHVGFIFQEPRLLPWLTVLGNVAFSLQVRGTPRESAEARARHYIRLVGLGEFENAYPRQLSGGMAQRASICRMLISNPAVLLLDEPFSALDELTRDFMNMELQRICAEQQATAFLVTHSLAEAVILSDRILVMKPRPGRIVEEIVIDLPRPRTLEMINTPRFGEIVGHIRDLLGKEAFQ